MFCCKKISSKLIFSDAHVAEGASKARLQIAGVHA
jgi:hypothetical protein